MTLRTRLSLAGMSTSGTNEPRPQCFHVYRIGGMWADDRIVRADDRRTPRYFLKGTRASESWRFVLHAGGPNGAVVCHAQSGYLGPPLIDTKPAPIRIAIEPDGEVVHVHRRPKFTDGMLAFKGLDDEQYRWQPLSRRLWGNRMECLNSQDQVVATYRITLCAISKDGELRIYEPVQFMTDLIVATCLAMRTPDH